jgi:hypothetical protein
MSEAVEWRVAVTPDALGRYRGTVEFSASGLNRHGETISRVRRMNVVARVSDCTAPLIADMPGDVTLEAAGPDGADLAYVLPTATDAVDGPVDVACDVPSGSRLPLGTTTAACSAEDAAGNVATDTFTITVADTTAPMLDAAPSDQLLEADDGTGTIADWAMPAAEDLVDGSLPVTCDPMAGSRFAVGATTVTCSAADGAGNVATASFEIEVTAPPAAPDVQPDPEPTETIDESTDSGTPDPVAPVAAPRTAEAAGGTGTGLPDTRLSGDPTPWSLPVGLVAMSLAIMLVAARRQDRPA